MAKLFNEAGEEVEAFTEDEIKEKQEELISSHKEELEKKEEEITKAKSDFDEIEEKIKDLEKKGENKDGQKERLKEKATNAEEKLNEVTNELTKKIKEMKDGFLSGHKKRILDKLSGKDEEIIKKIEFEADNFKSDIKNEVELEELLTKSAHIVNASEPIPNFLDNISGAGNKGNIQEHNINSSETDNSKSMRKVLDISDEDVKKFGADEIK